MDTDANYWMIVAGSGGSEWSEFKRDKVACIDFNDELMNILNYSNKADLPLGINQKNFVWQFAHDIRIGDYIIATSGFNQIFGIGQCIKTYYYNADKPKFKHCIDVEWLKLDGNWYYQNKKGARQTVNKDRDQERIKLYHSILEGKNIVNDKEITREYTIKLQSSKNIILRGAPGTGKTYLARQIAAEMIDCSLEDLEKSEQFGFVQFHPNYDYTDFIEGLRPVKTDNDSIAFERRNGIFMDFCERAKNSSLAGGQDNFDEVWEKYLEYINSQETKEYITKSSYLTVNSNHNLSVNYDSRAQGWSLPKKYVYELYKNPNYSQQTYYRGGGRTVIENMKNRFGLLEYIPPQETTQNKPFIFVIDEINRGDMAKIFGELFFSLDPGYRGKTGAVTTQFANLYDGSEGKVQGDKFYIPENVYIIGTMNDIDRSVDSFDFAMRRRFRFIEVTADSQLGMLDSLGEFADEAKARLRSLNTKISETEDLNQNYHIGPSYFLKLKELDHDYDILWSDYLEPLLAEYLRGTYGEEDKLDALKEAYHISVGEDDVANG